LKIPKGNLNPYIQRTFTLGDPVSKSEGVRIQVTGLTAPYLCACPKPGLSTSFVVIILCSMS